MSKYLKVLASRTKNQYLTIIIVLLFLLVSVHAAISLIKIITGFAPDFNAYYTAANNFVHHRNPYTDPHIFTIFNYPLMTAFFYVPLLLLPYKVAQGMFVLLSFIAFCLSIVLSLKLTKQLSLLPVLLFASLGFLSFPVKFTLGMGQVNLVALALLLGGFWLYLRQKEKLAIVFFTCAILLKPILLFTMLFFLLRKSWRMVIGVGGLLAVITVVTAIIYPKEMTYYVVGIPKLFTLSSREVYYNQGITGFISRLTPNLMLRGLLSQILELAVAAVAAIAVMKTRNDLLAFSILLTALMLIDSLSWQHHFVFLLFPWIVGVSIIRKKQSKRWFIPLIASYLLVSYNISKPLPLMHFPYVLVLSHVVYGTIILLGILVGLAFD